MPSERSSALQKLMGLGASMFRRGFNSSKCKTESKLATARIKLLRNRREAQVRQMRRDIAALLQSRQEDTARIRVEHVIREQNIMAANEIIELFCELIVLRLPIIAKQRECPADLKEGICSLIYAAPRCSDIPELQRIRDIFQKKYGKDFVSAAIDLRPESGVNRMLIEKLSVRKPSGEVKLKIMKEIAKEYQIKWDTTESELELLKPPEERLEGPCSFANAASMPLKPTPVRALHATDRNLREDSTIHFKDSASAARAAAESAERAASAAQAAAYLATQNSHQFDQTASSDGSRHHSLNSTAPFVSNEPSVDPFAPKRVFNSQSFHGSNYMYNDEDMETADLDNKKILRRNSCAGRSLHSDIRFDDSDGLDSDGDEKVGAGAPSSGTHRPPNRPPPLRPSHIDSSEGKALSDSRSPHPVAHVHPKLPDYEALAARFEALKSRKY